jgi:hypothetical protein
MRTRKVGKSVAVLAGFLLGASTPALAQAPAGADNASVPPAPIAGQTAPASPDRNALLAGPVSPSATEHGGSAASVWQMPVDAHAGHCPGEVFFDAEYLLLQPRRRAFDYAIVSPTSSGIPQGNIASLQWDTESGVRAGGGYRLPGDGWEIGAYYTYFHSNASQSATAPAGGVLFTTLTHPGSVEEAATATADSGLNYQLLDVEVGRTFPIGESCSVRLFGGGRFAWINQSLNAVYNGIDANIAVVSSPIDFDGAGLRLGGEGRWNVGWGFSLFARGSGSLLVGDFRTSLVETNDNGATTNVNVTDNFEKMVPVLEVGIGIGWQYRNFQASAAYEMANWFGMVDSPDFADDVAQGKLIRRTSDLNIEGLRVQLGISF